MNQSEPVNRPKIMTPAYRLNYLISQDNEPIQEGYVDFSGETPKLVEANLEDRAGYFNPKSPLIDYTIEALKIQPDDGLEIDFDLQKY